MDIKKLLAIFMIVAAVYDSNIYGAAHVAPKSPTPGFTYFGKNGDSQLKLIQDAHAKKYSQFNGHELHPTKTLPGLPSTYKGEPIMYNFKLKEKDSFSGQDKLIGYEEPTLKAPGAIDWFANKLFGPTVKRQNYEIIKQEFDRIKPTKSEDVPKIVQGAKNKPSQQSEAAKRNAQINTSPTLSVQSTKLKKGELKTFSKGLKDDPDNTTIAESTTSTQRREIELELGELGTKRNVSGNTSVYTESIENARKIRQAADLQNLSANKRTSGPWTAEKKLIAAREALPKFAERKALLSEHLPLLDRGFNVVDIPPARSGTAIQKGIYDLHKTFKEIQINEPLQDPITTFTRIVKDSLSESEVKSLIKDARKNPGMTDPQPLMQAYTITLAGTILQKTNQAQANGLNLTKLVQQQKNIRNVLLEIRNNPATASEYKKEIDILLDRKLVDKTISEAKSFASRHPKMVGIAATVAVIAVGLLLGNLLGDA